MIDPNNVTNFKRNDTELLEFWLFCLFVRGKNADVQARKLQEFIEVLGGIETFIHHKRERVDETLRLVRSGQYESLVGAIMGTIDAMRKRYSFLREATVAELEAIPGVGPKTSRFFVLHSRPKVRVAVLDTHILNYMNHGMDMDVPRSTPPSGERYKELEEAFLLQADYEGVDPAAFDLAIWRASRESNPTDWRRFMA